MGVVATLVFLFLWLQFEKSARTRLALFPRNSAELKEITSKAKDHPRYKALKAVFFSASMLVTFAIWEGCLWAVLQKDWAWGWQLLGLGLLLGLLYLRQRDYAKTETSSRPMTLVQASLFVAGLFLLTGPIVSSFFGFWFLLRLYLFYRKFPTPAIP